MTSAAVCARISSDRNDTALGVARQVKDCLALAEAKGWEVGEVFTDNDVSATSGRPRPEYERMMAPSRRAFRGAGGVGRGRADPNRGS